MNDEAPPQGGPSGSSTEPAVHCYRVVVDGTDVYRRFVLGDRRHEQGYGL
jgi:hypothetical protein